MSELKSIIIEHTNNYLVNNEFRYIDFVLKGNSNLENKLKNMKYNVSRYTSYLKGKAVKLVRVKY